MLKIDIVTARRFILGKQGLWPGRRWQGLTGTARAMREMEFVQLDPLQIVARSHDIALHSRVSDYTPGLWEVPTYEQRQFFDSGGWLATRPMDELPHWRVAMRREKENHAGVQRWGREHADAIAEMRALLRRQDTVSNRDFRMHERTRTNSYRGRKDSAVALYYLWRTGEVMTYSRDNFERVYALTEAVAPAELIRESDEGEADRFFVRKEIAFHGLLRVRRTDWMARNQPIIDAMLAAGELVTVEVDGWSGVHLAPGSDVPLLEALRAGRVPEAWAPLSTTTEDEAVFLAPLDPVSARGRAKALFGFDYAWEVYKPADKRTFGYYTLPVLRGERLVARFDSKLERSSSTLVILGFWLEDENLALDDGLAAALAKAFARFARFLGAERIDASGIGYGRLREGVGAG